MMPLKTKQLERAYKTEPKTCFYCIYCGRDLAPESSFIMVHLIDGGNTILHPDSEDAYQSDGGDLGLNPVGTTCVKKIGADWTHVYTP